MSQPKVSIIVPTRNSATTLRACLESVKKQTYPAIELVVVDRDSTDDTKAIAKEYTEHVYNHGPERSAQRNFAVSKSTGEYVMIIDSDMELSPKVTAACVEKMHSDDVAGVLIPEESFGKGFWAQCKKLERSFYVGVDWMEAARFFRRETYQKLGGYDLTMTSGEDWDLSQRVAKTGSLVRIHDYIYHNEGRINLWKTVKKKYYYAQKFSAYLKKQSSAENTSQQTGIVSRYKLFLGQPRRLWRNPILGLGMLFMKTCEFGAGGFGLVAAKLRKG